jgi:transcription initiation factor TFIID subunit 1
LFLRVFYEEAPLDDDFDDEAYLMVTQLHWEDDIIWNGEEVRQKVMLSASSVILVGHVTSSQNESGLSKYLMVHE